MQEPVLDKQLLSQKYVPPDEIIAPETYNLSPVDLSPDIKYNHNERQKNNLEFISTTDLEKVKRLIPTEVTANKVGVYDTALLVIASKNRPDYLRKTLSYINKFHPGY